MSTFDSSGELTRLLGRWAEGSPKALDEILEILYDELKNLAGLYLRRERSDHTLSPTSLVHEVYLRIFGRDASSLTVETRAHFFALAAQAMRRILVEHARRYETARRGSPKDRVSLEDEAFWARVEPPPAEILALDQALDQLRRDHPRQARVVELRYFGGLTEADIARVLEVSRMTVSRDWRVARLLLSRTLSPATSSAEDRLPDEPPSEEQA